jgi:hypothetical protein
MRDRIFMSWTHTHLFRVDLKRSFSLTVRAVANLDFSRGILVERTEDRATFATVKFDVFQLRKHPTPSGDHARDTHQIVEVGAAEVAQGGAERQVCNPNVHF